MIQMEKIQNKQRILFIGDDADTSIKLTSKLLNLLQKPLADVYTEDETLTDAPAVLINNPSIDHHILVVGNVQENAMDALEKTANQTPKSGTIIYNKADKPVAKICKEKREDVQALDYKPAKENTSEYTAEQIAAAKVLLASRLRIQENEIDQAINQL